MVAPGGVAGDDGQADVERRRRAARDGVQRDAVGHVRRVVVIPVALVDARPARGREVAAAHPGVVGEEGPRRLVAGPQGRCGVDLARQARVAPGHEIRRRAPRQRPAAAGRTERVQTAGAAPEVPGVGVEGPRPPLRVPRCAAESAHVDGVSVARQVQSTPTPAPLPSGAAVARVRGAAGPDRKPRRARRPRPARPGSDL